MSFLKQLRNRKVAAWTVLILLYLDVGLTYFLLKTWPDDAEEANPIANAMIQWFGLDWTLLVIMPGIFAFGAWIIYRWWHMKIVRLLAYALILTRFLAIPWHIYLAYAVFPN